MQQISVLLLLDDRVFSFEVDDISTRFPDKKIALLYRNPDVDLSCLDPILYKSTE